MHAELLAGRYSGAIGLPRSRNRLTRFRGAKPQHDFQAGLGLFVGRRAVFTSKIRSSFGPAKISHSRGVVSDSSPCKISVQCHVVMSFIVSFVTVAFALFS